MTDIGRYFDDLAPEWRNRYAFKKDYLDRANVFKKMIEEQFLHYRIRSVIEIGCGARCMFDVDDHGEIDHFACDISHEMLDLNPLTENLFQADFRNMPVKNRFDMVILSSVIEWLDDPSVSARLLSDLLMPGGVLLVSYPNYRSPIRLIERYLIRLLSRVLGKMHYRCFQTMTDYRKVKEWFSEQGFELKAAEFFGRSIGLKGRHSSSMELDVYEYKGVIG